VCPDRNGHTDPGDGHTEGEMSGKVRLTATTEASDSQEGPSSEPAGDMASLVP
jgi:hypothetical protein